MEQSILNEYGVIGSLLVDPTLFPEASGLSEDDFTLVPLCEVFRAMRRQYGESGSFDALTIRTEAGQHCSEVTDTLLMKTLEITPTAANLSAYTAAVKEASLGRKLAALGNELLSSEQAPAETLGHAQTVIQGLAEDSGAGEALTVADEHHPCVELFYRNTGGFLFGKPCDTRLSVFLCMANVYRETSKLRRCFHTPASLYEHGFSI